MSKVVSLDTFRDAIDAAAAERQSQDVIDRLGTAVFCASLDAIDKFVNEARAEGMESWLIDCALDVALDELPYQDSPEVAALKRKHLERCFARAG